MKCNIRTIIFIFSLFFMTYQYQGISIFFNKDIALSSIENTVNMRMLENNKIYINTQIATPTKNIKFYLKCNEFITYISDKNYKKEESTSYEFIRAKIDGKEPEFTPGNFQTDSLKTGYESKETLNIDDIIIKNFYFILVDKFNNDNESNESVIGLNLPGSTVRPILINTNFIEQLKAINLINKRVFSIFYFNEINKEESRNKNKNYDGQIVFGILPHELNDNSKNEEIFKKYNFNSDNLNWANVEAGDYNKKWKLKFNDIICINEQSSDLVTEIIIEQNFFTGISQFKQIIHDYFFEEFIANNICKEEKYYSYKDNLQYYFYSCESSIKSYLDKYNKNILEFKSKDLDEIFTFTLEELFIEYNNRLYFGVVFDEYQMYGWKLGRIFLEKYPLIFSLDNKAIGYYKQSGKIDSNGNNKNKMIIIILVTFILVLLLVLFFGFQKYRVVQSLLPRKLKANELNDEYSYSHIEETKREITTEMATKTSNNSMNNLGY